jgi:hypothetical protein
MVISGAAALCFLGLVKTMGDLIASLVIDVAGFGVIWLYCRLLPLLWPFLLIAGFIWSVNVTAWPLWITGAIAFLAVTGIIPTIFMAWYRGAGERRTYVESRDISGNRPMGSL